MSEKGNWENEARSFLKGLAELNVSVQGLGRTLSAIKKDELPPEEHKKQIQNVMEQLELMQRSGWEHIRSIEKILSEQKEIQKTGALSEETAIQNRSSCSRLRHDLAVLRREFNEGYNSLMIRSHYEYYGEIEKKSQSRTDDRDPDGKLPQRGIKGVDEVQDYHEERDGGDMDGQNELEKIELIPFDGDTSSEARVQQFESLERDMKELAELYSELSSGIAEQAEGIEMVETLLDHSRENTAEGVRELNSAAKLAAGSLPFIGAAVGGLVGGPAGMLIGAKGLALLGTVGLGAGVGAWVGSKWKNLKVEMLDHIKEE